VIIHREYEQGSLEWLLARAGIPTASEFDALVTPEFKVRTGQMPLSYLAAKVAEAWQGGPLPGFQSFATEQGSILEDEAIPWFELEHSCTVDRVGFITTDDGRIGCSPDGLLGEDGGIEIKCPEAHTHTKYLLAGELPKDYAAQVHGSMFVTGRPWWKFLSYRRHFPPLLLTIARDDEIQDNLAEALADFVADFQQAMMTMIEKNGGPPPPRKPMLTPLTPLNPNHDPDDLIP